MKKNKDIFITPKFWPDRENWSVPSDEGIDFDNLNLVLLFSFRQKFRLYYRNWVEMWRTYVYFSDYAFAIVPLIYIITKSWWVAGITLVILIIAKIFVQKKLNEFIKISIIIPGLFDSYLEDQFGELLPFDD